MSFTLYLISQNTVASAGNDTRAFLKIFTLFSQTFDSAMKECDARAKAEIVGTQVEGHLPESREIWQNKAILKML